MLKKQDYQRQTQIEMISIEDIVPKEHILRDIDRAMSFDFICTNFLT